MNTFLPHFLSPSLAVPALMVAKSFYFPPVQSLVFPAKIFFAAYFFPAFV